MIKVTNIPPDTSEDSLLFFFENRRKSGGGSIKELEYDPDTQSAVITFEDPEGEFDVIKKTHNDVIKKTHKGYYLCLSCESPILPMAEKK
jgi:hypothetical protein